MTHQNNSVFSVAVYSPKFFLVIFQTEIYMLQLISFQEMKINIFYVRIPKTYSDTLVNFAIFTIICIINNLDPSAFYQIRTFHITFLRKKNQK